MANPDNMVQALKKKQQQRQEKSIGSAASKSSYQESDTVKQAQQQLQQQLAQKPGAYQSQWQAQLDDTMQKILNREKFNYDLNGDALYQQYKNQYITGGKMAMEDTIGKAAAMTGGYGNSYAQGVGQQAYQGYLQGLNDKIPELYQMALDKYNQEGQDLAQKYAMLGDREAQDYSRFRDEVSDWQTEADRLQNRFDTERNFDYGKYSDDRAYEYQQGRDQVSDSQWQQQFDYGKESDDRAFNYQQDRDKVSDSQWQQQFDYGKEYDDRAFNYQQDRDQVSDEQWQKEFDEAVRQWQLAWDDAHPQTAGVVDDGKTGIPALDYGPKKEPTNGGNGGSGGDGYGSGYGNVQTLVDNALSASDQEKYIQDAYDKALITREGALALQKKIGNTQYTKSK